MTRLISKFTSRFARSQCGGVAIMAGFIFPVLFIGIGGSVDYTRAVSNNSKAQSAMDATVLALTRKEPGTFNVQEEGTKIFASMMGDNKIDATTSGVQFSINGQAIRGTANIRTKTFFLTFIGSPTMGGNATAAAIPPLRKPIEIALVLDSSGSMGKDLNGQSRIERLKTAVNEMFDTLNQELPPGTKLSASLIPYSSSVNLSNFRGALKGGSVGGKNQPTIEDVWAAERVEASNGNSYTLSDSPPNGNKIPFVTASEMTSAEPAARLEALSENIAAVRADVNALTADGWTAGHIGMAWGFYSLSPGWGAFWPTPPGYYDQSDKIIVLLSDGEFNTTYNIGDSPGAIADPATLDTQNDNQIEADAYFQDVCALARQKGVSIYAVALNLDTVSEGKLNACAGSDGAVYSADTAAELSAAFRNIALQLGQRRLTN